MNHNPRIISIPLLVALLIFIHSVPVLGQNPNEKSPPIRVLGVDQQPYKASTEQEKAESVNRILAMVGDHVVTMNQYRERYGDTNLTRKRLKPLVNQILLRAAADAKKLSPSKKQVQNVVSKQLQQIKSQGPNQFRRILQLRGLTKSEYKQQLRKKVRKQMLETRVLAHYYPELRQPDTRAAQTYVRARIMLIDNVSQAWQVYGWLKDNPAEETWNKLFEKYSEKIPLMSEHGDLGWFRWGYYGKKIEYRVYSLPLYSVSRPFTFRNYYALVYPTGYRIARSEGSNTASFRTYERFRRRFYRQQLFDRLRSEYTIVYPSSVKEKLDINGRT